MTKEDEDSPAVGPSDREVQSMADAVTKFLLFGGPRPDVDQLDVAVGRGTFLGASDDHERVRMDTESARTLEELDGERWGEPDDTATGLIRNAHRLRTVPIGNLSVDDLRLLLGQQIGVQWLVSVALVHLRKDPFTGGLYPGDLLNAVLRAGSKYWDDHPAETMSLWLVREALEGVRDQAEKLLTRDDWPAFG